MTRSRALIIINYHSASLTAAAIASARAASSEPLHVVVVDNSVDTPEAAFLHTCGADQLIIAERNLGYAGGINRGARATNADDLFLANPDVIFFGRSVDLLCETLATPRTGVVGPRFCWDDGGQWILPQAVMPTRLTKEDEMLARRSRLWRRMRDRRLFRARERFWSAKGAIRCSALSGAVLAMRRDVFDQAGGFDERFPLYFEEMDFLRRVGATGRALFCDSRALCRHIYNQSAGGSSDAAQRYHSAERIFFSKWYGEGFVRRYERPLPYDVEPIAAGLPQRIELPGALPPGEAVIEISPVPTFETAVGHFPAGAAVEIPAEILSTYKDSALYARLVDRRSARSVGQWVWARRLQ